MSNHTATMPRERVEQVISLIEIVFADDMDNPTFPKERRKKLQDLLPAHRVAVRCIQTSRRLRQSRIAQLTVQMEEMQRELLSLQELDRNESFAEAAWAETAEKIFDSTP